MKAEHRKELQTNALADRMGRIVEGVKSNPRSSTLAVWVVALLGVVTFGAWYFASGSTGKSELWVQLENSENPELLQQLADNNRGTMPGRLAHLQRARILLREGLQNLYSEKRAEAIKQLEECVRVFDELSREFQGDSLLVQECLMGSAKGEEALVGVPKADNAKDFRGTLNRALEFYEKLAKSYPDSFLGKEAAKQVKNINENRAQVEKFYVELNKQAEPKTTSK